MIIKELIQLFFDFAPAMYQESYDNCGLQVGDYNATVEGVLLTLDVTEEVLEEALKTDCNTIIAHHPLIFSGIKRLSNDNYIQRIIRKAIQQNVNIIAMHTNFDNIPNGVNQKIADKLSLTNTAILSKKNDQLFKLITYVPLNFKDKVLSALFDSGAGSIGNYSECSFTSLGTGSFKPNLNTQPFIGTPGGVREEVQESRIEVIVPKAIVQNVIMGLKQAHPYESVAYDVLPLINNELEIGAGLIGELEAPMLFEEWVEVVKTKMKVPMIRITKPTISSVKRVAICGGSGSFLLNDAIRAKADVFITADFKYHQFFDAEESITIMDIGHYETEQFTPEIFRDILNKKNINFAVRVSELDTNPIKYI
jgi:dinuclear metal center YbgI/SA1388 family protein